MGWPLKTIDELGLVGRGRSRHRPRDAEHLYGGLYPFIQTSDVKHSNLYITEYSQTYSDAGLAQSKLWKAGTLCITIAANIADTAILGIDACFPDSVIGFIPEPEKADARFIKYLFDALLQRRFQRFTQGVAQDNLSQEKLLSLKFPTPELRTQKRIADILSVYDDLIENNRRRIQLLEHSARLLYKEWFVRLRFPGYAHVKIKDGVPEGWQVVVLGDVAKINNASLGKNYQGEIEYIDISAVTTGMINETSCYQFSDVPSRARRILKHGDIIWSCVRPNRRSHAVIWNPPVNLIASTGFAVLTPATLPTTYLYQVVTTEEFVGYLSNNARGAAYPAVTSSDFESAQIMLPKENILDQFNNIVEPMLEQIQALRQQSIKLAEARDLLLPRLMNGEIEV
jgi:type I restriction enzyme, S subunit